MSTLVFDVRGKIAHFRRPDAYTTHVSYPFIPRTTLHGLIGAILGEEQLPGSPRCGIQLLNPVRLSAQITNMLSDKVGSFNRPISIELVVEPSYRIYYRGPLQDKLAQFVENGLSVYHTYLGSAYCLTHPVFVESYSDDEMCELFVSNRRVDCDTVVPLEAIKEPILEDGCECARVDGMLYEHLGDRKFTGAISLLYEPNAGQVSFVARDDIDPDRVCFFATPDGKVICLW